MLSALQRGGVRPLVTRFTAITATNLTPSASAGSNLVAWPTKPASRSATTAATYGGGDRSKTNQQERAIRLKSIQRRREARGQDEPPKVLDRPRRPRQKTTSHRQQRFKLSQKLKELRARMVGASVASACQEAIELFESSHSQLKWHPVICNQYIDILMFAGKAGQATQVYIDMKRNKCYPTLNTFAHLYRGAIQRRLDPQENTVLIPRIEDSFADLENLRKSALGPTADEDISEDFIGPPADDTRMQYRSTSIQEVRNGEASITMAYARYIQWLVSLGRHDDAWDIISRFSGSWEPTTDGFPRLETKLVDRWLFSYAEFCTTFSKEDIERVLELWTKYIQLLYKSAETVLQQYEHARSQDAKDAAVAAWKLVIPDMSTINSFARVASRSRDVRLCDMAFEAFRDHTDIFDATHFGVKRARYLPKVMENKGHSLCIKVSPSPNGQVSKRGKTFQSTTLGTALHLASLCIDHGSSAIRQPYVFYDRVMRDATMIVNNYERTAVKDRGKLDEKADTSNELSFHLHFAVRRAIIETRNKPKNEVAQSLLELFAVLRKAYTAERRPIPLDDGHYSTAAVTLRQAAVINPQFGLWWLQDRGNIESQRKMPWGTLTLMCARFFAGMLIAHAQTHGPRVSSSQQAVASPRGDTAVVKDEILALEDELVEDEETNEVQDAATRLYTIAEEDASSNSSTSVSTHPATSSSGSGSKSDKEGQSRNKSPRHRRASVESRKMVLDFLRAWKTSFSPHSDREEDLFPSLKQVHHSRDLNAANSSSDSEVLFPNKAPASVRQKLLSSKGPGYLSTVELFRILLEIVLNSRVEPDELLPTEEFIWMRNLRKRISKVKSEARRLMLLKEKKGKPQKEGRWKRPKDVDEKEEGGKGPEDVDEKEEGGKGPEDVDEKEEGGKGSEDEDGKEKEKKKKKKRKSWV